MRTEFHPERAVGDEAGYRVGTSYFCTHSDPVVYETREECERACIRHMEACGNLKCVSYGTFPAVVWGGKWGEPISFYHDQADMVMSALGIEPSSRSPLSGKRYSGSMSGDDMQGRVLVAMALSPQDEGLEPATQGDLAVVADPVQYSVLSHAIGVRLAREYGFLQLALKGLLGMAQHCSRTGRQVEWS